MIVMNPYLKTWWKQNEIRRKQFTGTEM